VPIAEQTERREALNIVLSMPAGTDAAACCAQRVHLPPPSSGITCTRWRCTRWKVIPAPSGAASPRALVREEGRCGWAARLNPRKEDLQRWREGFALRLREHGIDAAASRRLERFQLRKGERQSVRHVHARGLTPYGSNSPATQAKQRMRQQLVVQQMQGRYVEVASVLAESAHDEDRALALGLTTLANFARERSRTPARQR
jgi:hypothetical protein